MFCLVVWACGLEFARPRALLSTWFVLLHAVNVFIGCVHSCYVLCYVAPSLGFSLAVCFHVVVSCVNTLLMSFLISCVSVSCFAHGWWFVLLAWACVFVWWAPMALVLVFCVPCALTYLVSWLLVDLPHLCFISLPSSFAPFIMSLCLQSCASSSSYLPQLYPVPALPCPACQAVLPLGVVLVGSLFCLIFA